MSDDVSVCCCGLNSALEVSVIKFLSFIIYLYNIILSGVPMGAVRPGRHILVVGCIYVTNMKKSTSGPPIIVKIPPPGRQLKLMLRGLNNAFE